MMASASPRLRGAVSALVRAQSTAAASSAPPPSWIGIRINGRKVLVHPKSTVLQACEEAQVEVPRFCYHESLSVAGNCRMCIVEVNKTMKPVVSCAMPVAPGMNVFTETPMVHKVSGVDTGGANFPALEQRRFGSERSLLDGLAH